jgi:hypothetical protein
MKRPSPALVVAGLALFASLGGTGYAASQLRSPARTAASKHKAAPLTSKQVNKLIAAYVAHHHIGARGPQGPAGPQGATGGTGAAGAKGPQGPGAQRIEDLQVGEVTDDTFAEVGPWTLTMTCKSTGVEMVINGPDFISYTESFGLLNEPAATASNHGGANGFTSGVGNGYQQGIHAFLTSGSTMEDLSLEITASKGPPEECEVVGDAIPAS